jgi:hypothetical protein
MMMKQEIIQQLEQAWGKIPSWMKGWSSTSLERYLQRLGWAVDSNGLSIQTNPEKVAIAEKLVSDSFGRDIQLAPVEIAGPGTGRAHILRMRTSVDDPSIPKSFIVKLVNEDYPWVSGKAELFRTFFNEWATYEFFRQLKLPELIVPRFYGGDAEAGVIVIEDLGKVENAYDAVFGADATYAEEMLIGWMETIGRMHALTVGRQEMFHRIRSALGPTPPETSKTRQKHLMVENFRRTCELVGVKLRRGCVKEIEKIATIVANPGVFAALSKVDNTPGDCVKVGSKLKILDFEFGKFQHALLDATVLRMIYPTAWRGEYLTPASVIVQAETAYRKELMKCCPQAEDDVLFARAFVGAAAYWCLDNDGQFSPEFVSGLLEEDNSWRGRQRVVQRLRILAKTSEEFGQLPAIGATAQDLESKLCDLWPEAKMMAYYPAFVSMKNST